MRHKIAVMLGLADDYTWQIAPNASQGKRQMRYTRSAETVLAIVETAVGGIIWP